MGSSQQPVVAAAMKRLWVRYLPQLEERVAILHATAAALTEGTVTSEQREQACSAAHKLAGVLGTFGLAEGTDLAREVETFYAGESGADPAAVERLVQISLQLRAMLATRK